MKPMNFLAYVSIGVILSSCSQIATFPPLVVHQPSELEPEKYHMISGESVKFPAKYMFRGIEGFVKVIYDINTIGQVENINIVDSNGIKDFEKSVIRAVSRYKYKPQFNNGKPERVKSLFLRFGFCYSECIESPSSCESPHEYCVQRAKKR